MDDVDFETLEAALAWIDACDDGPRATSSSDEGGPDYEPAVDKVLPLNKRNATMHGYRTRSDEQEIVRLKANLAVPGRNRSRDLQKLELLELRVEAKALQKRVDELEEQQSGQSSNEELRSARSTDCNLYCAWKSLARKEKRLRRSAELENRRLRELLATQLKGNTSMKKLLRKQSSIIENFRCRGLPY